MKDNIKSYLRESRSQEMEATLSQTISELEKEGFTVEFGNIGKRTTYALLSKDPDTEILGYTFLKDMKFYSENVGKLKALQQAIARKEIAESKS